MTQSQLDQAVADATGESRRTIHRIGFSLVAPQGRSGDRCGADVAKFLDWDRIQRARFCELAVF